MRSVFSCSLCSQALERVSSHPALPELVSELTSATMEEAAASVRSCLGSIEGMQEFMCLSGVVNERVTCFAPGEGCKQLADLTDDGWNHIRRYVKLCDIMCDVTGPHESHEY
ncbi:hypothetical protein HPB51_011103 [Rhipicephalus microplus]|uniref:Uncharacterized protein n=1 Tax=Rhipicephalus microplus TaxID=6941 RepID=A0A9J6D562_RHIMP|nr:hypothetical protein HPB51_011103 [Rhipicephalus microplus]